MSYEYTRERNIVFTEIGIEKLLKIRDNFRRMLKISGAVREEEAISGVGGDSWAMLACVDYLVERGEIKRVYDQGARQHNIYVDNR